MAEQLQLCTEDVHVSSLALMLYLGTEVTVLELRGGSIKKINQHLNRKTYLDLLKPVLV